MSLASLLPSVILDTVLGRLALLFLTGAVGDLTAARRAAGQMLAAYHPGTEDELRLAAEIISFSFHALEALSQAADPDLSLNQQLPPARERRQPQPRVAQIPAQTGSASKGPSRRLCGPVSRGANVGARTCSSQDRQGACLDRGHQGSAAIWRQQRRPNLDAGLPATPGGQAHRRELTEKPGNRGHPQRGGHHR
jgi:hypothetical protein